ncbi:MAG TPA: hypothetical protein VGB15_20660, partial [Longimicrobium sp.]
PMRGYTTQILASYSSESKRKRNRPESKGSGRPTVGASAALRFNALDYRYISPVDVTQPSYPTLALVPPPRLEVVLEFRLEPITRQCIRRVPEASQLNTAEMLYI